MSAKIQNIEGLTVAEIQDEIAAGAKFVMYQYCISIIVMTFRRPSDIYFIRSNENALTKGLQFSLLSLVFGWWGIPWGQSIPSEASSTISREERILPIPYLLHLLLTGPFQNRLSEKKFYLTYQVIR